MFRATTSHMSDATPTVSNSVITIDGSTDFVYRVNEYSA